MASGCFQNSSTQCPPDGRIIRQMYWKYLCRCMALSRDCSLFFMLLWNKWLPGIARKMQNGLVHIICSHFKIGRSCNRTFMAKKAVFCGCSVLLQSILYTVYVFYVTFYFYLTSLLPFVPLSMQRSKSHQSSKMPVALKSWVWESKKRKKKKQGPSVIRYNTIWPLISADTKADSSVASLVTIPAPNHHWIPTVILSSLLLNIYNTSISGSHSYHLPNESITTKSSFIFNYLII